MPSIDSIVDPVITVRNLLVAGWVNTNITPTLLPSFSTGRFDRKKSHSHQITISEPDEVIQGGPATGYSAIRSDGGGGSQIIIGEIQLGCWSSRAFTDISGFNPKAIAYAMGREVRRIIMLAGTNPGSGLHTIAPGGYSRITDTSESPVAYQGIVVVTYTYETYA